MLEFIQWGILFLLGTAVGYLVRSQRHPVVPVWVRDIDPDELVTKAELDQYHHQVIQISQAQRDLIQARFEELARLTPAACHLEVNPAPAPVPTPPGQETCEEPHLSRQTSEQPASGEAVLTSLLLSPTTQEKESGATLGEVLAPLPFPATSGGPSSDSASKAIALFLEGRTIDQIAQELRIGRQEAQLLIRMGRPQSRPLAGVS